MTKPQQGYTIIEVMIFLVISGAMLSIAIFGTRGTQDSAAFRQSINAIELKIRETFNNVDNGYFANSGNYVCSVGAVAPYNITVTNGVGGGTSAGCVFLGKRIYLNGVEGRMTIRTIIGARDEVINSTAEPAILDETYNYSYSVLNANASNIAVSALRDKNVNGTSDLRAKRTYSDDGGTSWVDISGSSNICFSLGSRKAKITITQNDLVVDYNGAGCPP